ncbi:hypothetical protein [Streptomyces canus]|uniref:hypothetical protein n=1 Tax=Streptomyces canus TaxID=58343 RepID=UPI003863D773
MAREGLRLLVQAIEKPDAEPAPAGDPPVELVVRASTAPPPTGGRRPSTDSRGAAHASPTATDCATGAVSLPVGQEGRHRRRLTAPPVVITSPASTAPR